MQNTLQHVATHAQKIGTASLRKNLARNLKAAENQNKLVTNQSLPTLRNNYFHDGAMKLRA